VVLEGLGWFGLRFSNSRLSSSHRDSSGSSLWRREHTDTPCLPYCLQQTLHTSSTSLHPPLDQEYTNYHFDVAPAHLQGALDRLAQFFVKPLFLVRRVARQGRGCMMTGVQQLQGDVAVSGCLVTSRGAGE
jgi:hypothetical protein